MNGLRVLKYMIKIFINKQSKFTFLLYKKRMDSKWKMNKIHKEMEDKKENKKICV